MFGLVAPYIGIFACGIRNESCAFVEIRIPESGKFLLVESEMRETLLLESGIQLKESGISLKIGIRNPRIRKSLCGIRNLWREIQNPISIIL